MRPKAILNKAAYQYWDNKSWQTNNPAAASTIIPAPVGELSVRWSSYYRRWIMMYLNNPQGLILLRTARSLTGPSLEQGAE